MVPVSKAGGRETGPQVRILPLPPVSQELPFPDLFFGMRDSSMEECRALNPETRDRYSLPLPVPQTTQRKTENQ